jgi:hypothetical protein
MELLRQLLELASDTDFAAPSPSINKYPTHGNAAVTVSEEVDDIVKVGSDYVPMKKPGKTSKQKRHATTDKAQNSLINTLWFYGNSDAS